MPARYQCWVLGRMHKVSRSLGSGRPQDHSGNFPTTYHPLCPYRYGHPSCDPGARVWLRYPREGHLATEGTEEDGVTEQEGIYTGRP